MAKAVSEAIGEELHAYIFDIDYSEKLGTGANLKISFTKAITRSDKD